MIKKSFPLRILIVTFLVLALPLLIDSFIYFQIAYNAQIKEAKEDLIQSSAYRAMAVAELEPVKSSFLTSLSLFLDLPNKAKELPDETMNEALRTVSQMQTNFEIYILQIGDEDGLYKILGASDPKLVGTEFVSFIQVKEALDAGGGTIFRYIYSQDEGLYIPALFILYPITSEGDKTKPQAALMLGAPLEKQLGRILAEESEHRKISFALLNFDGIVFAATDPGLLRQYFTPISPSRRRQILDSKYFGNYQIPENPIKSTQEPGSPFFEFIFNNTAIVGYRS